MKSPIITIMFFFLSFVYSQEDISKSYFPKTEEKVDKMPPKENVWIFIMAGQSNMAGRARISPSDTIPNSRVITINKNNEWVYAKEPLHFYEPEKAGLDCGLSFGNELAKRTRDHITIALIPCAVGGSSAKQWLNDQIHRDVKLLSNFKEKVDLAKQYGTIKGILWHQGESDAVPSALPAYKERLPQLFKIFRDYIENPDMIIMAANLGLFASEYDQIRWDAINAVINLMPYKDRKLYPVSSQGLTDKGDKLHFDANSQRELGKRFALTYISVLSRKK
ncbi:sialate O-acetylesterase [Abyssalbus ytuae]|uniref:Sialate O-acetylesterase n=1 Tax=Abyssalbus ytuae TaxID=2926907 RepID=A0A9E6ZSC0_9FLAO|nr:sialate O-acetylesterase [Abyssalbus ytuae]UOB16963.1 sialate O-acetylesterase [Abyssalbus ytuae]